MKCAIDKCGYTAGGFYGAHWCRKHDDERIASVGERYYADRPASKPYTGLPEAFWAVKLQAAIWRLTEKAKSDKLRKFDEVSAQSSVFPL